MECLRLVGSLKNLGLFAEYRSVLWGSFAKETYIFKEATNRSHPTSPAPLLKMNIHTGIKRKANAHEQSVCEAPELVQCVVGWQR